MRYVNNLSFTAREKNGQKVSPVCPFISMKKEKRIAQSWINSLWQDWAQMIGNLLLYIVTAKKKNWVYIHFKGGLLGTTVRGDSSHQPSI